MLVSQQTEENKVKCKMILEVIRMYSYKYWKLGSVCVISNTKINTFDKSRIKGLIGVINARKEWNIES